MFGKNYNIIDGNKFATDSNKLGFNWFQKHIK